MNEEQNEDQTAFKSKVDTIITDALNKAFPMSPALCESLQALVSACEVLAKASDEQTARIAELEQQVQRLEDRANAQPVFHGSDVGRGWL